MNSLENIIKNARYKNKLNKSQLSKKSGVSRRTITEIEQGITKKPKINTIINISKVLDLNVDDLFELIDYTDDELDEYYSNINDNNIEFKIVIQGYLNVPGKTEEDVINECAYKIANALGSVDGMTPEYDQLKSNSQTEIYMKYLG